MIHIRLGDFPLVHDDEMRHPLLHVSVVTHSGDICHVSACELLLDQAPCLVRCPRHNETRPQLRRQGDSRLVQVDEHYLDTTAHAALIVAVPPPIACNLGCYAGDTDNPNLLHFGTKTLTKIIEKTARIPAVF